MAGRMATYDEAFYSQFLIDNIENYQVNIDITVSPAPCSNQTMTINESLLLQKGLRLLEAPKLIAYFTSRHIEPTGIYEIGSKDDEPVYRMSAACARNGEGSRPGDLFVHEDGLFPLFLLETCGPDQVDVTIVRDNRYDGCLISNCFSPAQNDSNDDHNE